jgi:hypothetical protein
MHLTGGHTLASPPSSRHQNARQPPSNLHHATSKWEDTAAVSPSPSRGTVGDSPHSSAPNTLGLLPRFMTLDLQTELRPFPANRSLSLFLNIGVTGESFRSLPGTSASVKDYQLESNHNPPSKNLAKTVLFLAKWQKQHTTPAVSDRKIAA